ncbi:MAG: hypothetical protein JNL32_02985 [Candidatus Kapabacteria bacterium]|nr:hypothetical protein [Candidatus Kapabacteria bacterium]
MQHVSILDKSMGAFREVVEQRLSSMPAPPFSEKELRPGRSERRRIASAQDFWNYDRTYFTPDVYEQFYEPPPFHREMIDIAKNGNVEIFLAARDHGKTVVFKKYLSYLLLHDHTIDIAGTYSETLPKAKFILSDVQDIISNNPRIVHDYRPIIHIANTEEFEFSLEGDARRRTLLAFGEGRSVRGTSKRLRRPKFILADDVETLQSSFSSEAVRERQARLAETYQSLGQGGRMIVLGNNFDERGAFNKLLKEQQEGILPHAYRIHVFPAWITTERGGKPLWEKKFPVRSESELKAMVGALNESDWQGNYMQNPIPPDGEMFPRSGYAEYAALPADAKLGAMYTDPNCSLKGKGDTTAAPAAVYSPSEDAFYILDFICASYSDPNKLLDDIGGVFRQYRNSLAVLGFDGNVSQESTWTAHVRNYQRITGTAFHRVEYKRYNTDAIAKNAVMLWKSGKIRFPMGFAETPHGSRALQQIFSFAGKKNSRRDDAPDALIGLIELMHERHIVRKQSTTARRTSAASPRRL